MWIVFATEQGYDYDGDEYWHTFERRMPLWDRRWRPNLRSWFGKFQKTYRGLLPIGRWANFFSIIAWPITYALLPKVWIGAEAGPRTYPAQAPEVV